MKLHAFDFDGTLIDSPMPETGKPKWEEVTGEEYPHKGWWGRPESLNTDVLDVEAFPNVKRILDMEYSNPESMVIILTSRIYKLKPALENVLAINNIKVDDIDLKKGGSDKGERVLRYLEQYPDINEINVYDDSDEQINVYLNTLPKIPDGIVFNIFSANEGNLKLVKSNNDLVSIINEVINDVKK